MKTQTREHLESIINTKGIGSHLEICYKFAIEKKNVEAVRYIRNYLESSAQGKWSWEGEDASKILDKYEKQAMELLKPENKKYELKKDRNYIWLVVDGVNQLHYGAKKLYSGQKTANVFYNKNLNHYQVTFSKKDNPPKHRIHSQLKDIVIFKGTAKLN
tara:strand:+ start:71 stop:547 length:477 start_codon:yes stop_codon:yes gene_type:complete